MNKTLLLVFFWAVCTTLSFGQSGTNLDRATRFAILASTEVTNTGTTTVTGDLGISPGSTIIGEETLIVTGAKDLGNAAASAAMQDAQRAFDQLNSNPSTALASPIGSPTGRTLYPGVHRVSGSALLSGLLYFDARGNSNEKFVILIEEDFSTEASARVLLLNGAQSQNIFWVAGGNSTVLGNRTTFHGSILAKGDITANSVNLTGRLISLEGAVNLISSDILQPIQFESNLAVQKSVAAGNYLVGDEITYTITAVNNGPTNAVNVIVQESLPAGLELVSATTAKGSFDATANRWLIGNLSNEERVTLTLVFKITQPGTLQNSVSVASDYFDPNTGDNAASVTITATCPALPAISISGNAEICDTNQTITYTATFVEGATYDFDLPDGWTLVSQQDNVLEVRVGATGTLGVTVTDQCNRTASGSLAVAVVAAPAVPDVNGNDLICDITQTYTYFASGVSENVTYTWIVGGSFVIESGQGTGSVVVRATSLAEGTISLRTTNVCSVSSESTTKTVKVSAIPETPAIAGESSEVCVGTTVTYNVTSPVAGETYTWQLTGGLVLAEGSDLTGNDISVVVNGDGALSVSATNECGTSAAAGTLAVTTVTIPAAPETISGDAAVCRGGSGTYQIAEANADLEYTWTPPTGWRVVSGQGTGTITATPEANAVAGNFTVTATNKCGTSAASAPFAVTIKEVPDAPAITGDRTACVSETPVVYSVEAVEGVTYTWSTSGNISIEDGVTTGTQVNVTISGTGTLTVTATNECGPTPSEITITPTEPLPAPANLRSSVTGEVCEGTEITLTVDAVAGASSYTWGIPEEWDPVSEDLTTNTLVVIANTTGNVTVAAVNKCGAGTEATLTINVTPKPVAPAAIKGDLTACVNAAVPVTYSIDAVAGATDYIWTVTQGDLEIVAGTERGTEVDVLVRGTGTLMVTSLTNTCAGGSVTTTITPSVTPAAPDAITGAAAVCRDSEGNVYSVPAVEGLTYNWTPPAGWIIESGNGTNSITATATPDAEAGNFTVVANNKCGNSVPVTFAVTLKETPAAPVITGDETACVSTIPVTYSVTPVEGQTYTWRLSGDVRLPDGVTTLTGSSISVIVGGTGAVFVTANNECGEGAEGTLEIIPTERLAAPANIRSNVSGQICEGQQVTFNIDAVDGATSYNWILPEGWDYSPSNTTELVATAGASGVVRVTAIGKCGAGAEVTMDVTVTPTLVAPTITSSNTAPCVSTAVTYRVEPVTGATGYSWTVDGNYTPGGDGDLEGDEITITPNGPVTITVVATNGICAGVPATLAVTPTTAPDMPGTVTGPAEVCAGSTNNVYTIDEVPGATTYEWEVPVGWTFTGQGTRTITVTATNATGGNILVKVNNACFPTFIESAPKAVAVSTPPAAVTAIQDNSTLCDGLSYTVVPVAGAATYNWVVTGGFEIEQGQGTTTVKVRRTNNNATDGGITVTPVNALGCAGASFTTSIDATVLDGQLSFPKAFSPNGDGNNDTWEIANLEQFSENEVTIFNRYGSEVYRKKNYQNDWTGNGLEKGTYFYKVRVKLCDGAMREFTGYTTIFR